MSARRRENGERFPEYRENLKNEERWTAWRLAGRLVWPSEEKGTYRRKRA